jgi:glycosyltransferase involved in cell wall biosynthesis
MGEQALRGAWQDAAECFVISETMGKEYCRRYGQRSFQVVTDGLTSLNSPPARTDENILRVYFMGLFHMAYEQNLRALLEGLAQFQREHPNVTTSVTLRCEHVRAEVLAGFERVTVLPFADEAQVQRDLVDADLLYMPIPFGAKHENFARYSLSTKMVTYVGSGLPILYHGPQTSAAYDLLRANEAAFLVTTLEPKEIAASIAGINSSRRAQVTAHARTLARRDFMLADQVAKFWGAIERTLTKV